MMRFRVYASQWVLILVVFGALACNGARSDETMRADLAECELQLLSKTNELNNCNARITDSVAEIAEHLEAVLYRSVEDGEDSASPEDSRGDSPELTARSIERPSVDVDEVLAMSRQIARLFEEQQETSEDLRRQIRGLRGQVAEASTATRKEIGVVRDRTGDISDRVDRSDQLSQQIRGLERQLGALHRDVQARTDAVGALVRDFDASQINCSDCGWFGNKKLRDQVTGFHNDLLNQLDALPDLEWSPVTEGAEEEDSDESNRLGPPI